MAIATIGSVYTSISGLRQSWHWLIWSLRHDKSWICDGKTPVDQHLEQTAIYECKRLGDGELCNATSCKSISWSPTLADIRVVLEYCYAAKQHLVHSIWSTHKWDLERGMLKQQPTLDITSSNRYQVWAHIDMVQSHFIQSARDNILDVDDLHRFQSDAEHLELIDSLLADSNFPLSYSRACGRWGMRFKCNAERVQSCK